MALSTAETRGPRLIETLTPSQYDDAGGNRVMLGFTPAPPALRHLAAITRENAKVIWPLPPGEIPIQAGLFRDLLRLALEQNIQVDECYYLLTYPDVGEAVAKGLFTSSRHHYLEFGYFEDRLPFRVEVDDAFYFRPTRHHGRGEAGTMPSAQVHFERHGYKEGRLPREGWSCWPVDRAWMRMPGPS